MRFTSPAMIGSPHSRRKRKPAHPAGDAGSFAPVPVATLPAEKQLGGRAHHLRVPHRLEGELGVHRLDALDAQGFGLYLLLDQIPHRAHGARQREGYIHVAALVVDAYVVDQTELHEVHPDLGVYDVPELVSHSLLRQHSLTSFVACFPLPIVSARPRLSTFGRRHPLIPPPNELVVKCLLHLMHLSPILSLL